MEAEWAKLVKQETHFLSKRLEKKDSKFHQLIETKVPAKLKASLDLAFAKAFGLIFQKGTGIIEKTYRKSELEKAYQINAFTEQVRQDKKSLQTFRKKAVGSGSQNQFLAGVAGIGMGAFGVGLPDIPVFTGILLKSIYEIALNYGFTYESEQEKRFILLLIQGAVSYGNDLLEIDQELNSYMEQGRFPVERDMEEETERTARCLSGELLYMKFLQGVPVVGAIGGAYDAVYIKQVTTYAELKYRRRFYLQKKSRLG